MSDDRKPKRYVSGAHLFRTLGLPGYESKPASDGGYFCTVEEDRANAVRLAQSWKEVLASIPLETLARMRQGYHVKETE